MNEEFEAFEKIINEATEILQKLDAVEPLSDADRARVTHEAFSKLTEEEETNSENERDSRSIFMKDLPFELSDDQILDKIKMFLPKMYVSHTFIRKPIHKTVLLSLEFANTEDAQSAIAYLNGVDVCGTGHSVSVDRKRNPAAAVRPSGVRGAWRGTPRGRGGFERGRGGSVYRGRGRGGMDRGRGRGEWYRK